MDDKRRIALAETLTVENGAAIPNPTPVVRYQLDNHLGSASLELDGSASVISYEEYYPYGDTCFRAGRSAAEVSQKRYRYTGKEKDEESGLYYHGARYYACWLGRWTAADPIGVGDGVNLYMYVQGNPVRMHDPSGMSEEAVDQGVVLPKFDAVEVKGKGPTSLRESKVDSLSSSKGRASGSFNVTQLQYESEKSCGELILEGGSATGGGHFNNLKFVGDFNAALTNKLMTEFKAAAAYTTILEEFFKELEDEGDHNYALNKEIYETYFGEKTPELYGKVKDNFQQLFDFVNSKTQITMVYKRESEHADALLYVNRLDRNANIYVPGEYEKFEGEDAERGGILILHELLHRVTIKNGIGLGNNSIRIIDFQYESNTFKHYLINNEGHAKDLARKHPQDAVRNAYNYQFFINAVLNSKGVAK